MATNNVNSACDVYKAPKIEFVDVTVETGFAGSWNDGSISDEQGNYNYWDNL